MKSAVFEFPDTTGIPESNPWFAVFATVAVVVLVIMHYLWQNWLKLAYKIDRNLEMHFEGNLRAIAGFSIPEDSKRILIG
jgi:hypothetical protein